MKGGAKCLEAASPITSFQTVCTLTFSYPAGVSYHDPNPVSHRITFKLCLLTWKTLHTAHPPYLSELITHYLTSKALRSSNTNLLARPSGITSNFTSRAFSVSPPSQLKLTAPIRTSAPLTNYQPLNVN